MDDTRSIIDSFDLLSLIQADTCLKKVGRYWIGPCGMCGGRDRLVVKETPSGSHIWICRVCSPGKYHDAADYIIKRDGCSFPQAIERMKTGGNESIESTIQNRIERASLDRQAEIDARLSDLTTHEIWEALHRRLEEDNRAWWRMQGIPDEWQDYLSLGFTPDKTYYDCEGMLRSSPAYTIPYFHYDPACDGRRRFVTLQYRLTSPVNPLDRYRFEHGLASSFYMTTPTMPLESQAVICEGAKKAIVARALGGLKDKTVIGLPSKSDTGKVEEYVKGCERVWVMLDPDAQKSTYDLCRKIGKNARAVELPVKIDDALVGGYISKVRMQNILRQGVKL